MSRSLFVNPSKNFVLPDELGALAGKDAVDWLSADVTNKPTIPNAATAGTGLTKTGDALSVNADQPQVTSIGTLGSLSVGGTGGGYTVNQFQSGLATAGFVGTQVGVSGGIRNNASYGFVNTGGNGATSNNMFLGVGGAPKIRIDGVGSTLIEAAIASTSTTTGSLRIPAPGGAGIGGDVYVGGVVNTPTAPTAGSHLANKTYVDAQTVTAGTGLTKTGTALAVDAAQPGITSLGTLTGLNVAADINISGYRRIRQTGGNSYGYTYGAYNQLGDGINFGYNAYNDNTAWVINAAGGGTSRIRCTYGGTTFYTGAIGLAPTDLHLAITPTGSAFSTAVSMAETLTLTKNAVAATAPTLGTHLTNKTYVDAQVAGGVVAGTGLTKTGTTLSVNAAQPGITSLGTLTALSSGLQTVNVANTNANWGGSWLAAYQASGPTRWHTSLNNAETPDNGSDWGLFAHADNGNVWYKAIEVRRNDGYATFSGGGSFGGNLTASTAPATGSHLANKTYVDAKTWDYATQVTNKPTTATQANVTVTHPPMGRPNWGTVTSDGNFNEFTAGLLATSNGYSYRLGSSRSANAQYVSNAFDDLQSTTFWQVPLTNYDSNGIPQHVDWTVTNVGTRDGSWMQMQVDRAITVTSYTMRCPADSSTSGVSGWIVCGSNDGTTWTELSTVTAYDVSLWTNANGVPATFTPAPAIGGAYTYWRIHFTNCKGTLKLSWLDFKGPATQPAFDQLSVTGRAQAGYLSTGNVGFKVWYAEGRHAATLPSNTSVALPAGCLTQNVISMSVATKNTGSGDWINGAWDADAAWKCSVYCSAANTAVVIAQAATATGVPNCPWRVTLITLA